MCGIVGYIGPRKAVPILVQGLKRLEYRGYDSSGVATMNGGDSPIFVHKRAGRIKEMERSLPSELPHSSVGIAHTRWATHGPPNDVNSHPHLSHDDSVAVVHNGIIENSSTLKKMLSTEGVVFRSDTDTEVIPNLVARFYDGDLEAAVDALEQGLFLVVSHGRSGRCDGRIGALRGGKPAGSR